MVATYVCGRVELGRVESFILIWNIFVPYCKLASPAKPFMLSIHIYKHAGPKSLWSKISEATRVGAVEM